ncbi:Ankyrin and HET domain protein [Tolypocladium capitatum]|uniref:Ankyrin and HET domain protein n=1 Tax=Tolypocladium capitatum TaxID=45235 RepID=A0A2K3QNE0_9HYPO|nr:Ankyrin and HET domain protein [Tolypocladium capitatum]
MAGDYQYRPLRQGEIRLLRLDPVRSPEQALSGSIVHHLLTNPTYHPGKDGKPPYLERPQSYEAVSYHWGSDPRTPHRLFINDGAGRSLIRLTAALHTLLRRLALSDRERVLWADAICINQVSSHANKEKGEQIQLMPDIYRIASRVQIYLGPASPADDVPAALDLLATIADYSEYLDNSQHAAGEVGTALAQRRGLVLPPPGDGRWPALRAFLRRPWFRRVWVIQEFVYATDVVVACGGHDIDWRTLWLAAKAYCDNRHLMFAGYKPDLVGQRTRDAFREAHEGARALQTITDLRMRAWGYMTPAYMILNLGDGKLADFDGLTIRKDFNAIKQYEDMARSRLLKDRASGESFPFGRPDMLDLLHRTNNFLATQPVDRLYGLLGLAEDAGHLEPVYSAEQTLAVVTARFAASFIRKGRLAVVLATAGIRSEAPAAGDPPSWVPHWTKVRYAQEHTIGFNRASDIEEQARAREDAAHTKAGGGPPSGEPSPEVADEALPKKLYNAALDTAQEFRLDEAQGTLTVTAVAVDRVLVVLPGRLLLGTPMYANMIKKLGQVYPTGEPIEEALWRSLVANRTFHGLPAPEEYAAQYQNLKRCEAELLSRAAIRLGIGCLVALPLVTLAIRYIHILAQVAIVAVAVAMNKVPVVPGVVFIVLLPVFRWLWTIALAPVLVGLTWYLASKVYAHAFLDMVAQMGVTAAATTGSVPEAFAGYLMSFSIMANRYTLCFTEHRLMGLLPLSTKVGDVVVVIHGCHAPFVVRPTEREGHFRLVGECYVHGVMNGECMAGQSVEITLC